MNGQIATIPSSYDPSLDAWPFHNSLARFRILIWGIKSGKSHAGARETARAALGLPGRSLIWVVAPTYQQLEVAESELEYIFEKDLPDLVLKRNMNKRTWTLPNKTRIQFKSGDWPDNLRGPNADFIWFDEGGFLKVGAWRVGRQRVTATLGEIVITTTPPPERSWLWNECLKAGMPPSMEYGQWDSGIGSDSRFVSHYPTWQFPWVTKKELDDERDSLPRAIFDREYGALFVSTAGQVFGTFTKCLTMEAPPETVSLETVMGLDLAKFQDWTAVIMMDSSGRILDMDRWQKVPWPLQKVKIIERARRWGCVIVMDKANAGSVIEDDLKEEDLTVYGVDMNSPMVKNELIMGLQVAIEQSRIKIPDPRAHWSPDCSEQLTNELTWYAHQVTKGGRLSYSAPRGLTDDMVIALGLANLGRAKGYVGGIDPGEVVISRERFNQVARPKGPSRPSRPNILKSLFQRKSILGQYDPMWRQ